MNSLTRQLLTFSVAAWVSLVTVPVGDAFANDVLPNNPWAEAPTPNAAPASTPAATPAPRRARTSRATDRVARAPRARAHQPAPAPRSVGLDDFLSDDTADPLALVPDRGAVAEELPPEPPPIVVERAPAPAPEPIVITATGPRPASHMPAALESSRALERRLEATATPRAVQPPPAPTASDPQVTLAPSAPVVEDTRHTAVLAAQAAQQPAPATSDQALGAVDNALTERVPLAVPEQPFEEVDPNAASEADGGPARDDVQQAITRVTPAIQACVVNRSGHVGQVRATFASSGRVTTAVLVTTAFTTHLTAAERSCIARTARAAQTQPFELDRFEVTFPVHL